MAASDITVAALTASPTLRGNKLAWTYNDPRSNALPNIGLDMVEVHASTTNDRTTATKVGEGITDFLHAGLVEEQNWYYWIKARDYLGSYGAWYPSGSTAGISATAIGISGLAFGIANGKLVATVVGNALTVAIKTSAGNNPSAADPVYVAFRNASLASGSYSILAITTAVSVTISSGSTMGFAANIAGRVWVQLFNDDGVPRLALRNCLDVTTLLAFSLDEYGVGSTLTTVGVGAANYAGGSFSDVAVTSKPFRILGFVEWTGLPGLAVPGTWDRGPDVIQMFGPGVHHPGELVQTSTDYTALVQWTTGQIIPFDNTIPQKTEGLSFLGTQMDASSAANIIQHEAVINFSGLSGSGADKVIAALFRGGASDAICTAWKDFADGGIGQIVLRHRHMANFTVPTSFYSIRLGTAAGVPINVNGIAHASMFGGTLFSSYESKEFMG